jgi:catechol 2,3-dioxygenase-like lactoylglutathione lyase family enzyme
LPLADAARRSLLQWKSESILAANPFRISLDSRGLATRAPYASAPGGMMSTIEKAKQMAKSLRTSLDARGHAVSHAIALEMVAQQLGYKDWNTAAARLPPAAPSSTIVLEKAIPILRMFDEAKAREFYLDFLGFSVEFEHRFEASLPLYLGINRDGLQLHLSEHHGDASPGATVFVPTRNIERLQAALIHQRYGYGRPEIIEQDWGKLLEVHDPFGNRIRFCQG